MGAIVQPRERGILFSASMVRALLDGSKTQTRRAVTLTEFGASDTAGYDFHFRDKRMRWHDYCAADFTARRCPYGKPGDLLWVRETHAQFAVGNRRGDAPQCVAYRATCSPDGTFDYVNNGDEVMSLKVTKWTPAIHMPKWAARIWLEITDVRVQRVREINHEDARAEGVESVSGDVPLRNQRMTVHQHAFANLWDSINAARGYGWDANPWVWAVSFKRVPAPTKGQQP